MKNELQILLAYIHNLKHLKVFLWSLDDKKDGRGRQLYTAQCLLISANKRRSRHSINDWPRVYEAIWISVSVSNTFRIKALHNVITWKEL